MADQDQTGPGALAERTRLDPLPRWPSVAPDDLVLKNVHGDSMMRRLRRAAAGPFRAAEDVQALEVSGHWIQHPVTTGRRIAVTGIRGGAGKSTVSTLIAAAFARFRRDRVLALDLDPEFGSLPLRLGVRPGRSATDLTRVAVGTASFEEVETRLERLGERLWALPGSRDFMGSGRLDAAAYRSAGLPLSRFFGVTIADCGAGIRTDLHRAVLADAHAQLLVTPATPEGAASAGAALDWLGRSNLRGLVPRTIVVFTVHSWTGSRAFDLAGARRILRDAGAEALLLGYDGHLAIGTTIDPEHLGYSARISAIELAAAALRAALRP
ncbi:AAA family ATPase [Actinomadura nitritigenes]|uniref:nucleotide-binding protein n=1 Tax=Actinomadura nitritigenes TaxID=134602 RepID=UPI003D8C101E